MGQYNFDQLGTKVHSPDRMAHVVLQTTKVSEMARWYKDVLGANASYENDHMSFLTFDEEHHRIAVVNIPGTTVHEPMSSGLNHIAFTYNNLEHLLLSYRQRKAKGILPVFCINHGTTISFYYKDPDGNRIECQVDCFDTAEEGTAFMMGPLFAANPIGTDVDPEDLIKRMEVGEDVKSIKKRVETGTREIPIIG
ncbi:Glyoxalase/Bleomycin resistance protein/Dihydroxybiphenyl dioxygenase [Xylogone sp. PMI_703]|nr:Glyoxalase/Bleomycin resistance protein/Dihydroxybiphenyl dioxygenase [Xylogone sp. PMI_703]